MTDLDEKAFDLKIQEICWGTTSTDLRKGYICTRLTLVTEGDTKSPGRQDPQVRVSDIAPRGQLPRQRA